MKRFALLSTAILALAVSALAPAPASGANLNEYLENIALNGACVGNQRGTDAGVWGRIWWVGSVDPGDASITVSAAGNITFEGSDGTVDSTIGTAGFVHVIADMTWGEIADEVNSSPNWAMRLMDVLPDDVATSACLALSETGTNLTSGRDMLIDLSVVDYISYSVGPEQTGSLLGAQIGAAISDNTDKEGILSGTSYARGEYGYGLNYRSRIDYIQAGLTAGDTEDTILRVFAVRGNGSTATKELIYYELGSTDGNNGDIYTRATTRPAIVGPLGARLVVKYGKHTGDTVTATAGSLIVDGFVWR